MPPRSQSLQKAMDRGDLIVAPTALAASSLRGDHDRSQRAAGRTAWQPANVLSWQQWLGTLWTSLVLSGRETRLLLNTAQEELLWRDLIADTLDSAHLTSAPAFAQLARSAFALAAGYSVTAGLTAEANTEDTEQFARWSADFTRLCGRHAYLPAARLPAALREHLVQGSLPAPAELHLTNFLDLPPAEAALLDALRAAGTRIVDHPHPPPTPISRQTLRAANDTEELRAVAYWLRAFFESHSPTADVSAPPTIGVVLAGARPDTALLDTIFREVLAPELDLITADAASGPWEFATGTVLAELPIVATLLRLLRGLIRPLPVNEVTALLLSPYLGPAHDRNAAAQLDAWSLRDRPPLRPELTYRELQRLAERSPFGESTLQWLRPIAAIEAAAELHAPRTYAAWMALVRELAEAVSWPGQQPLTPQEFAATRAWDHLLDSVATLDFTGRRVPFAEALAALEHQAQTASVTLPTQAAIRILSATEAASVPCDALVLAQATDTNWPPAARPHPLLPWHLQASAGMPGANTVRDSARAERLTNALLAAPHVLISYAAEANEAPQRLAPSFAPLAPSLALLVPGLASLAPSLALKGRGFSPAMSSTEQSAALAAEGTAATLTLWRSITPADLIPAASAPVTPEQVLDDRLLPPLPSPQVSGGAAVLQLQAACGFRAFAELRLRSNEPHAPELGFDARRAGSLLHQALDTFWQRVHSQAELHSLSEEGLDEHLQAAIEQAFSTVHFADDPWDRAYRSLQMHRLFELLKSWMSFEKQRAPFTVLGSEEKQHLSVGPLELELRVDRIDKVASLDSKDEADGTVLIDYKTGYQAHPAAWEGDRPDQPQLPLYTLLPAAGSLRGLAFARVRAGQFTWAGVQAEPGLLPKARINSDLGELVSEWRSILTRLAEQFAAGDHSVNPKSFPTTCTYCGQRFLCRLDPNKLLAASAQMEDESELEEENSLG